MTAIAPRKPIPKLLIGLIVLGVIFLVAGIIVSIALFNVEQERIANLKSVIQTTKATDSAAQSSLLGHYTALYQQILAKGDTPAAPAPSTIETTPGATGPAGQNATESQVRAAVTIYCDLRLDCEGPQGLAGATGANGVNGADGPAGAQGPQGDVGPAGANGSDGQPPMSWTYTDALSIQHNCTRTDPFDASAPTYTCN